MDDFIVHYKVCGNGIGLRLATFIPVKSRHKILKKCAYCGIYKVL